MSAIIQYLKDTRAELRHVAWPTNMQTIVYTILVIAISIGIAAYLGASDFVFTRALSGVLNNVQAAPQVVHSASSNGLTVTPIATGTVPANSVQTTSAPASSGSNPQFNIPGASGSNSTTK